MSRVRATFVLLLLFVATSTLAAQRTPGWFGLAFTYRVTLEHGKVARGWMQLCSVAPNGPAARAGLAARDLITHVNGRPLRFRTQEEVAEWFRGIAPGERVRLRVRRGDAERDVLIIATSTKV
jgi:S1-C subfamily serine protease